MTEKSAEDFIPGEDELDAPKVVVNFNVNDARIAKAKEEFKDIDASNDFDGAKQAAKVCQKMRATLTDAHKLQKADALEVCRVLDAEKRRLMGLIAEVEDPIKAQIEDIEQREKLKELTRIDEITYRIETIRDYGLNLDGMSVIELQETQELLAKLELDSQFEEFLVEAEGAKAESESRLRIAINKAQAREEEEAKLEQQRKDQAEQQEKLDAQQRKLDEQVREQEEREREISEAREQRVELADKQAALDKQKAEQDERDRAEREAKEAEEADRRRAELAPDKEKLTQMATRLTNFMLPDVESQQAKDVLIYVRSELKALIDNIKHYAGEME